MQNASTCEAGLDAFFSLRGKLDNCQQPYNILCLHRESFFGSVQQYLIDSASSYSKESKASEIK